jgi:REP element-mobilizing transposase RayT
VAGSTIMITRRCFDRMFLLKPSRTTNALFGYILAVAAKKYAIRLHAYCVMSNHFHCVLTDPEGRLPAFEQYMDSLVARSFNALYGRWDYFWTSGSYSAVELATPGDVVDKAAYVLANPVVAGLVRAGKSWPGLWSAPERIGGRPVRLRRPKHFFRENGPMPESVELELVCPPGFDSAEALRAQLVPALAQKEAQAHEHLRVEERAFLGVQQVLAQDHDGKPSGGEPRRVMNPRVACRDKWKRVEAIQRLKAFRQAYREAWLAFARGVREAVFPHGTYWMRVMWSVRCASE